MCPRCARGDAQCIVVPGQSVGVSFSVRAIRRFTIRPALPEPLASLRGLMLNLRWSWHPETLELFEAIDPAGWERAGQEPAALLAEAPPDRLAPLPQHRRFLQRPPHPADPLPHYDPPP